MAGRARDVLTLLEAHRSGDFLRDDLREAARLPRVGAEAQAAGPGWGFSWLGAVLVDPAEAASGWSKGSVSWGRRVWSFVGHRLRTETNRRLADKHRL